MKVAFATTRGTTIDEHFGRAAVFSIWDIRPGSTVHVEDRRVAEGHTDSEVVITRGAGEAHDDALFSKIDKLADVKIVYFTEIGGPSAAKLVQRGIMPLKAEEGTSISTTAATLAETMATKPAPWMRKALAEDEQEGR
jgi:nitrogen fixation protein NifX